MTEKEFSKLRRRELLELLLMQTREQKQLEEQIDEKTKQIHDLQQSFSRLEDTMETNNALIADMREYQDEQEEVISRLKKRLDDKDVQIEELQIKLAERERLVRKLKVGLTKRINHNAGYERKGGSDE